MIQKYTVTKIDIDAISNLVIERNESTSEY